MLKEELKMISKPYYEALGEGKIMGRKCIKCGHIECPPHLACNACGCLDTEWIDLTDTKVMCTQVISSANPFVWPMLSEMGYDWVQCAIQVEGGDEWNSCLINTKNEEIPELCKDLPFQVKPVFMETDGYNNIFWERVK